MHCKFSDNAVYLSSLKIENHNLGWKPFQPNIHKKYDNIAIYSNTIWHNTLQKKEAIIMAVRFPRKISLIMLTFVLLLITLMGSGIFAWLFLSNLAIQKQGFTEPPVAHYI